MYKLLGQKGRKLGNKGCLPGNSGFFFFERVVTVAGQLLLLQLLAGIASSGYRVLTVVVSDRG
jgi:hypothetical protein